ncbi:hypothetical protein [Priestia filamentosa]|uniref:hypothetical protein n=1 Tax=Priestia filamentosa TaxID=1402861 RepID=UPI003977F1E6
MKLKFETWVSEQNFSEETKDLFAEGVICYKAGAYRASLLLSYLGFQSILKQRIIEAPLPVNYESPEWNHKKSDVVNDKDNWERKIQDLVKDKTKKKIFNLSEDIYNQYFYWKDRRNDCAHAKGNTIDYPHVEAFWLFIQSNSYKFVINGGKQFIINQLSNHFDKTKTPPGQDITPVVSSIPDAVEESEYRDILNKLKEIKPALYKTLDDDVSEAWKCILNNKRLQDAAVSYLTEEENFSYTTLLFSNIPNLVKFFANQDAFIRSVWKKFENHTNDYAIFINMMRHSLIPDDQIEEASSNMFSKIETRVFGDYPFDLFTITDTDKLALQNKGFFDIFYREAFEDGKLRENFNWANRNKELICYYIKHYGLDEIAVWRINQALHSPYPPRHLIPLLVSFYNDNPSIKQEHINASIEMGDEVPDVISIEEEHQNV